MKFAESLSKALEAADDDYLMGLSNKGIFNRAKKDFAAQADTITVEVQGDSVLVNCGNVVCTIGAPLGASTCSCPSTSMCRHRLTSILWLKSQLETSSPEPEAPAEKTETPEPEAPAEKAEMPETEAPAEKNESPEAETHYQADSQIKFPSLAAYPLQNLLRKLGVKKTASIYFRVKSEGIPELSESSVITVKMPWIPATVRLLEPLEFSTCSCHSGEICVHKAEALIYYQLEHKIITPENLESQNKERNAPDYQQTAGICLTVRQTLAAQLTTGIARLSPYICDTLERMAGMCHTAQLPALEKQLRAIGGEYTAYFKRSATFRDDVLLRRIAACYRLALQLENAEDPETRRKLAGTFRTEYELAGSLKLYMLGWRKFNGRGGFAGTIYYFWETEKHVYYTYTIARPTYYDSQDVRRYSSQQSSPWGLTCKMEKLKGMTLTIEHARVSEAGRISASSESQAVLEDHFKAGEIMPGDAVYSDYSRLAEDKANAETGGKEYLACVSAVRCDMPDYDKVRQVFTLILYDEADRDLYVEVRYRKEEKQVVEVLESLAKCLKDAPSQVPVFFGSIYAEDGLLKMYPVEFYTDWSETDETDF